MSIYRKELVDKAVRFLTNKEIKGTVSMKLQFLSQKGLNEIEIIDALNKASDGVLLETALGGN